jgi:hypothetical protein
MREAVCSSKTSSSVHRTTARNIPEDSHLRNHRRKNLQSQQFLALKKASAYNKNDNSSLHINPLRNTNFIKWAQINADMAHATGEDTNSNVCFFMANSHLSLKANFSNFHSLWRDNESDVVISDTYPHPICENDIILSKF